MLSAARPINYWAIRSVVVTGKMCDLIDQILGPSTVDSVNLSQTNVSSKKRTQKVSLRCMCKGDSKHQTSPVQEGKTKKPEKT